MGKFWLKVWQMLTGVPTVSSLSRLQLADASLIRLSVVPEDTQANITDFLYSSSQNKETGTNRGWKFHYSPTLMKLCGQRNGGLVPDACRVVQQQTACKFCFTFCICSSLIFLNFGF